MKILSPEVTAAKIAKASSLRPWLGMVLGSGFGQLTKELDLAARIPYKKLPGFPPAGVSGHAGELCLGHVGQTPIVLLNGRAHFYEGHSLEQVTFAIRTLAAFGIRDLVLTNAAGGVNRRFAVGQFMLLSDHINLMGVNPLRGPKPKGLPQFVDLTRLYDPTLSGLLAAAARLARVKLRRGVYLAVSGPSYETPAEIRAFARLGADAVGMSTVPEAIVARQCGLSVAGLSCITNLAAGINPSPLSHEEVLVAAKEVKHAAAALLRNFARLYGCRK